MRQYRRPLLVLLAILLIFIFVLHWDWVLKKIVQLNKRESSEENSTEDRVSRSSQSMVLSLDYFEQTVNALKNLMDLQCWAKTVNITKVVEPSIYSLPGKAFHFSVSPNLMFRDYFDIRQWNSANFHHNSSVLVSLTHFLQNSYRTIIFVQLKYSTQKHCESLEELADKQWFQFFVSHGFDIRTTCFFVKSPMDEDVFRKKISLSLKRFRSASIVFNQWRGISKSTYRLKLKNSRCVNHQLKGFNYHLKINKSIKLKHSSSSNFPIAYSRRVLKYCSDFVSEHLHGSEYVVVMVRTEKLDFSIVSDTNLTSSECIQHIKADLNKAHKKTKTTKTLFFTDSSIHGTSAKMYKNNKAHAAAIFSKYLEKTLDPLFSAQELDKRLESITKSQDSILIALIQSALAVKADALVTVGGGSFQALTKRMYINTHGGSELYPRMVDCSTQMHA